MAPWPFHLGEGLVPSATMHSPRSATLLAMGIGFLALPVGCDNTSGGAGGSSTSAQASVSASTVSASATASSTSNASTSVGTGSAGTGGAGTGGAGGSGPLPGYGALSGTCGEINLDDIVSPSPAIFDNTLDFSLRPAFDVSLLSPGGQAMYAAGNLNQSSLESEIFAYEVLYRCEGAAFLKGEAQIVYAINGKKTDLLVDIDGEKVGVSVVRAESFPKGSPYPVSQALNVLEGKLSDIHESTANVDPQDAWKKQILSVIAQTPDHALAIEQAYTMVDPATVGDTLVVVTVTEGDDDFIYY